MSVVLVIAKLILVHIATATATAAVVVVQIVQVEHGRLHEVLDEHTAHLGEVAEAIDLDATERVCARRARFERPLELPTIARHVEHLQIGWQATAIFLFTTKHYIIEFHASLCNKRTIINVSQFSYNLPVVDLLTAGRLELFDT